jgi:hypothetical protein
MKLLRGISSQINDEKNLFGKKATKEKNRISGPGKQPVKISRDRHQKRNLVSFHSEIRISGGELVEVDFKLFHLFQ